LKGSTLADILATGACRRTESLGHMPLATWRKARSTPSRSPPQTWQGTNLRIRLPPSR
jgi:hypothetical protein